ncbi:MAG: hypothetical protein R3268_13660 [Acidiferrobacterales bacterium]|nr:hypothetical protein [Acidiferrobacterales bacterium]
MAELRDDVRVECRFCRAGKPKDIGVDKCAECHPLGVESCERHHVAPYILVTTTHDEFVSKQRNKPIDRVTKDKDVVVANLRCNANNMMLLKERKVGFVSSAPIAHRRGICNESTERCAGVLSDVSVEKSLAGRLKPDVTGASSKRHTHAEQGCLDPAFQGAPQPRVLAQAVVENWGTRLWQSRPLSLSNDHQAGIPAADL